MVTNPSNNHNLRSASPAQIDLRPALPLDRSVGSHERRKHNARVRSGRDSLIGLRQSLSTLHAALSTSAMRRILIGYFAFAATEWAAWVAILLYAFDEGGTRAVGLVALAQLLPAIVVAPIGSAMSERLTRQTAVVVAYGALSASMAALWLVSAAHGPSVTFYAAAVVSNCVVTLCRPAHYAALPRMADSAEELVAANSASSTVESLGVFAGPALIAVVIPWLGLPSVFLVLGVLDLAAVAWIATVRTERPTAAAAQIRADGVEPSGFVTAAREGLVELRTVPGATTLLALIGVQFVLIGMLDVLAVVFPQQVLGTGPTGPSVVIAASGIGGLVGAAATVLLVGRARMTPPFIAGFLGATVFFALISVTQVLATAAVLAGLSGFARAFIDVSGRTLLQRNVREDTLARVFGIQESVLMAGLAVGSVVAPVAVALAGPRGAFVVAGLLPAALALAAWPSLRRLDHDAVLPGPDFALLRRVSLFSPLAPARLELLSRTAASVQVGAGDVVIHEGDVGDRFYVVADGEVSVFRDDREVARLGVADHFGEVALLRDAPRNATVTATVASRLLAIGREDFLSAVTGLTLPHAGD